MTRTPPAAAATTTTTAAPQIARQIQHSNKSKSNTACLCLYTVLRPCPNQTTHTPRATIISHPAPFLPPVFPPPHLRIAAAHVQNHGVRAVGSHPPHLDVSHAVIHRHDVAAPQLNEGYNQGLCGHRGRGGGVIWSRVTSFGKTGPGWAEKGIKAGRSAR